ncbi:DUF1292 domain-containing protein [Ferviditalea candida]|uniref:UPF0473 protein VF724_14960 n=1 Tax=Ferviditalea candida TaxID=3108399 RepID=A0ABU5ZKC3_9BACL|nr:DUF1292 domain-containing protein [Paenibacillaceae bacterium T2]
MSGHQHDGNDIGHEHDEEEHVFILTDEEGQEHEMVMVYTFETEGTAYAVLLDRNDIEAEGVIFRIEEEGEEAYLVNIEDDEEWERVVSIYNQIAEEQEE